jgi:hypothetical protein
MKVSEVVALVIGTAEWFLCPLAVLPVAWVLLLHLYGCVNLMVVPVSICLALERLGTTFHLAGVGVCVGTRTLGTLASVNLS